MSSPEPKTKPKIKPSPTKPSPIRRREPFNPTRPKIDPTPKG